MSLKSRGIAWERCLEDYLVSLGFVCDHARASVRPILKKGGARIWISSRNDILGAVDIIGVNAYVSYTLFVQAATDPHNLSAKQKKLEAIPWNHRAHRVLIIARDGGIRGGVRCWKWMGMDLWKEYRWTLKDSEWPPIEVLGPAPIESESVGGTVPEFLADGNSRIEERNLQSPVRPAGAS